MLVAISGKAGSGKDTVGMFLQALSMADSNIGSAWGENPMGYAKAYEGRPNLKGGWQIKKFADKMKALVASLLGVSVSMLEDRAFKESTLGPEWNDYIVYSGLEEPLSKTITVRDLMRAVGIGLRNTTHKDIWINGLLVDYKGFEHGGRQALPNWIITDMRFVNEFQKMLSLDAYTIRVNRPGLDTGTHESEIALDNAVMEFMITNEGTLEDLLEQTRKVYEHISSKESQVSGTDRRYSWEFQFPERED